MIIWHRQCAKYCSNDSFPDFWNGGKETIESYLVQQIKKGNAIIVKTGEIIVGYMAWVCVNFHNEKTAFAPLLVTQPWWKMNKAFIMLYILLHRKNGYRITDLTTCG